MDAGKRSGAIETTRIPDQFNKPRRSKFGRGLIISLLVSVLTTGLIAQAAPSVSPTTASAAEGVGTLRIVKSVEGIPPREGLAADDFEFDVYWDRVGGSSQLEGGLRPAVTDPTDQAHGEISVAISGDPLGQQLRVVEAQVEDYIPTFGGDCDAQGHVTVGAGEIRTCEVTNTFVQGAGYADALLTLDVSVDSEGGYISDFAYDILEINGGKPGDVVADDVQAINSEGGAAFRDPGAAPATSGKALVGLASGPNRSFQIIVDRSLPGWATVFSSDEDDAEGCDSDGAFEAGPGGTPVCSISHVFLGQEIGDDAAALRIVKTVIGPDRNASVQDFQFDIEDYYTSDYLDTVTPEPDLDPTQIRGEAIVFVPMDGGQARSVQVSEQPVPDYVATFGGDCSSQGVVILSAGRVSTCEVTNLFVEGADDADALLTLDVTVDSDGGYISDFAYDVVRVDTGLNKDDGFEAEDVQAHSPGAGAYLDRSAPSTSGTASVGLHTAPDIAFRIDVVRSLPDWGTVFSGDDCHEDGTFEAQAGDTPVCYITHIFLGQEVGDSEAALRIVKTVVGASRDVSVDDFLIDVNDYLTSQQLETVRPEPGADPIQETGEGVAFIPIGGAARSVQVVEQPVADFVASYSGDCNAQGVVPLAAGQVYTCYVTNTFVPEAGLANALLTLDVSIDSDGAYVSNFSYNILQDDGGGPVIVAENVVVSSTGMAAYKTGGGTPSTTGTASVGLNTEDGDTFIVEIASALSGWATVFSGDCPGGGGVVTAGGTPVCSISHVFTEVASLPQRQAPIALDDFVTLWDNSHDVTIDVLANDGDANGNLAPDSLTIVQVICPIAMPNCGAASATAENQIFFQSVAVPLTVDIVYEVCDTTKLCDTATAEATLGPGISGGDVIDAPPSVIDNPPGAVNDHQQAFLEVQTFELPRDVNVDGGQVTAGTCVNSYMIFLNIAGGGSQQSIVGWQFDTPIVGVMSDPNGTLEAATSDILGAPGTTYPGGFNARGLEAGGADGYTIAGTTLNLTMYVSQPGDWVRVLTACYPTP